MSRIVWLSLFALLANSAYAQHRVGPVTGGGRPVRPMPVRPVEPAPRGFPQGRSFGGYGYGGYGYGYGNRSMSPYGYGYGWVGDGLYSNGEPYDGGFDNGYPPQPPGMNYPPFPPPQVMFQPPPRPVQSVIHDYTSVAAPSPAAAPQGEPPTFGIVLKDGSVRNAVAVVVDDDGLKYTDSDGQNVQLSMYAVDRAATRNLNRQRNLTLWLPATP